MSLFAHHTESTFKIEFLGRDYPTGMAEHAVMAVAGAALLGLVAYGAFALVRDVMRWRRRKLGAAE